MFCQCTDHVIGLVAVDIEDGDIESGDQLLNHRNRGYNIFRRLLPVGLVSFKPDFSHSGCHGIESHPDMGGLLFFQQVEENICKAEHGRCVYPFGGEPRVFIKGKIGPVDEGHGIEEEEFFFGHGFSLDFKGTKKAMIRI